MLKLINISKQIDERLVLSNINLTFEKNLTYVILGPSGIGKTTLLNIISSLDTNYTGEITNDFSSISFAFQDQRLIPWLTVEENIIYVQDNELAIDNFLEMFNISHLKNQLVKTLSGGEKHRVSLARAFVNNSPLILIDESLSSLDLKVRFSIINKMNIHLKEHNQTLIYISHNIDEALLLADKIVIFNEKGEIENLFNIDFPKELRQEEFEKLAIYEKQIMDSIMK